MLGYRSDSQPVRGPGRAEAVAAAPGEDGLRVPRRAADAAADGRRGAREARRGLRRARGHRRRRAV